MLRKSISIILMAACVLLIPGCSTVKRLFSEQNEAKVTVVEDDTYIKEKLAPPTGHDPEYISTNMDEPSMKLLQRPEMTFSGIECEHVRISRSINPFPSPESGEMVIDLDSLAAEFCYPYDGKLISPYGMRGRSMHSGLDLKAIPGDTIRAAMPGVVRMSKLYSSYGNIVVIRHYNGLETVYSHNVKNLVNANDVVEAGDPISLAGRTGRATTEHLHFEVRVASDHFNPNLLLDTDNRTIQSGKLYIYDTNNGLVVTAGERPNFERLAQDRAAAAQKAAEVKNTIPVSQAARTTSNPAGAQYHTIKSGETLSHLARTYSTTVPKICNLNGISSTKILQIGEKVRVK